MAKRSLFLLFTLLCISLTFGEEETSIFYGRSADIILKPHNIQDGSFVIFSGEPFQSENLETLSAIEETSVADFISHLVGGSVVSFTAPRSVLSSVNAPFYNKAKANLLFVVNEADERPNLSILSEKYGKKISLKRVAYPQDYIASQTTLGTGVTPSVHGIVGNSWRTQEGKIIAYKSQALPTVAGFQDIVSQGSNGRSLTVTASGDYQMSAAFGVHRFLHMQTSYKNNYAFSYSTMKKAFLNIYGANDNLSLNVSKGELLEFFSKHSFALEGVKMIDNVVQVSLPEQNIHTSFNLGSRTDFFLFAEMGFVYNLLEKLQTSDLNKLVNDDVPDLYSFSFSSLKEIAALYGKKSAKYSAAIYLIDSFIKETTAQFSALYKGRLATEVAFMKPSASNLLAKDRETMRRVYAIVRSDVASRESFDAHYPGIYLQEGTKQEEFCSQIRSKFPLEVICTPHPEVYPQLNYLSLLRQNDSNGTVPTNTSAAVYQTVLWSSILLALITLGAIYTMYNIDIGKDSMLYRMTSVRHVHQK